MDEHGASLQKHPKEYRYRFDFLGDSYTSAFGVLSNQNKKCMLNMKHIQSCLESWAVKLSNRFEADYRVMAYSGKGVYKNCYTFGKKTLGTLFTQITDNSKPYSYQYQDKTIPDVIFSWAGSNDYTRILHPDRVPFVRAYKEMLMTALRSLLLAVPEAKPIFICLCGVEENKQQCRNIKTAVEEFRYAYGKVHFLEIGKGPLAKENLGCIGHPDVKGQQLIADLLYPQVKEILERSGR